MVAKLEVFKMEKFIIKNKTSLITGAGGLLGYEHACALLEIGSNVILTDINIKKLEKNIVRLKKIYPSNKIEKYRMDITNEKSVEKCRKFFNKKKIFINILINNAAYNPSVNNLNNNLFEKYKIQNWKKEIDVGLTGAFICTKIFGNEMAKKKGGVILNISSDLSVISPDQRLYNKNINKKLKRAKPVSYSITKTGLIGLTRYIATYWANKNIRCNAISPGGIYDGQDKIFVKKLSKLIPLGRMAKKNEYRSAIQFLCSEASSYMTGQNLIIDGGRSIW